MHDLMKQSPVRIIFGSMLTAFLWLGLGITDCAATNLNDLFNLPIWQDSSLWDDEVKSTARRLNLRGTDNEGSAFYRGSFGGKVKCLGADLYAMELYSLDGKTQRLVLAFANAADLAAQQGSRPASERDYLEYQQRDRKEIESRLTGRLGPPGTMGKDTTWSWMGHLMRLKANPTGLTLTIEKGDYSPVPNRQQRLVESGYRPFDPAGRVERRPNGDVVISQIPPISQGNRNFCVPASWEKNLRYFGLALNVYELAEAGGTSVQGSLYRRFANQVAREIEPIGFRVSYLRGGPDDYDLLSKYIDQGLPVVWAMDARLLPQWVLQSQSRRSSLPAQEPRQPIGTPAFHALLIIGYNRKAKEVALSDSTELGHRTPEIWASAEEIRRSHVPSEPLIALLPPNSLLAPSRPFKTKLY